MFDIGIGEFIVLAVLALFVFGPEKLPKLIADVTRTLREVRRMAQGAQRELTESFDPGLKGIDLQSLDPRTFVKRTLLEVDDLDVDARDDRERLTRGSTPPKRSGAGSRPMAPTTDAADTSSEATPTPAPAASTRRPAPWDDDIT